VLKLENSKGRIKRRRIPQLLRRIDGSLEEAGTPSGCNARQLATKLLKQWRHAEAAVFPAIQIVHYALEMLQVMRNAFSHNERGSNQAVTI
jgi:hypothetical protein